mmetsp:Transcript_22072/g.26050  ORF Transcript_22072/g.26050 Transcript_22072/m.26050 type:complete len:87 (+) Transcript_22072:156-416(+)
MWREHGSYIKIETTSENVIKGQMRVFFNQDEIYSKGPFHATNPQPRPSEVGEIIETIFPTYPITPQESKLIFKLHEEQIKRGKSKH